MAFLLHFLLVSLLPSCNSGFVVLLSFSGGGDLMEAFQAAKFVSRSITLTSQTPSVSLLHCLHCQVTSRIQAHEKRASVSHEKNPLAIISASIKPGYVSSLSSTSLLLPHIFSVQETKYYTEIIIILTDYAEI